MIRADLGGSKSAKSTHFQTGLLVGSNLVFRSSFGRALNGIVLVEQKTS